MLEQEELFKKQYMVVARKMKRAIYLGKPFQVISLHSSEDECKAACQELQKQFPDEDIRWKPAWFIASPADDL